MCVRYASFVVFRPRSSADSVPTHLSPVHYRHLRLEGDSSFPASQMACPPPTTTTRPFSNSPTSDRCLVRVLSHFFPLRHANIVRTTCSSTVHHSLTSPSGDGSLTDLVPYTLAYESNTHTMSSKGPVLSMAGLILAPTCAYLTAFRVHVAHLPTFG